MFETSIDIAALFKALAAFQGACQAPKKTSTNPHFKSKFADLAEVIETVRAPMASNGLSFFQAVTRDPDAGGSVTVVTQVNHESGQWIRSSLTMSAKDNTPQSIGSASTYARRYALQSILGVAAEADDDANSAQAEEPRRTPQREEPQRNANPATARPASGQTSQEPADAGTATKTPQQGPGKPVTDEQRATIKALLVKHGVTSQVGAGQAIQHHIGVPPSAMTFELANTLIGKLESALKEVRLNTARETLEKAEAKS